MLIGYARALHDALEFAHSDETLIVWKLDRLARSNEAVDRDRRNSAGQGASGFAA
jgi:DNA invertase Pin-like site-specific DNA recombinase